MGTTGARSASTRCVAAPCLFDRELNCEPPRTQTLHTPTITFDIQQLVLNSTSKLLAVVGLHSVAVVVLPRKGWAESIGASLDCRCVSARFPAHPPHD